MLVSENNIFQIEQTVMSFMLSAHQLTHVEQISLHAFHMCPHVLRHETQALCL